MRSPWPTWSRALYRASLDDRMAEEQRRFDRYRRPAALLVIDLDHFKRINDTHGHDAGDAVLKHVADVIRASIRDVDFAARFGGSPVTGGSVHVTASIDVSACPECVDDPAELFASADQALYAAKEAGRNRVTAADRPEVPAR